MNELMTPRYQALDVRKTHRYVGSYSNLDEWDHVAGSYVIGVEVLDEGNDYDYGGSVRYWLKVETESGVLVDKEDVKNAISDSYTSVGCAHEWDCCGCASTRASEVKHHGGPIWSVDVSTTYNY